MLDIYQCNSERVRAFPASAVVYYTMALSLYSEAAYEDVLAALYHERWEVELVRQEFYGWMMAHYAVRWLMYQGATQAGISERTLSFVANVQLLRRSLPQAAVISPCAPAKVVSATVRRRGKTVM